MESSNVERILQNVISSANAKLASDKALLDSAMMERQAISAKIERKKADLERLKQRLDTLQKIRWEIFKINRKTLKSWSSENKMTAKHFKHHAKKKLK